MLDFAALAAQMEKMLDEGRLRPDALPLAVEAARRACADCDARGDFNHLLDRAAHENRVPDGWHPARLWNNSALCEARTAPDVALPHFVAAADGSQIYPDAHQIADCYLLHISGVALRYEAPSDTPVNGAVSPPANSPLPADGASATLPDNAVLRATPHFFQGAGDDAWLMQDKLPNAAKTATKTGTTADGAASPDAAPSNAVPSNIASSNAAPRAAFVANRELVDARRHVAELDELAALLETAAPHTTAIGLCDGIFDLRVAASQPWRERAAAENERALDALRQCGHPIGGYIAASRATDVVTALRVVLHEIALAERDKETDDADEALARLTDARLFDGMLQTGQRSATFEATRGVSRARDAGNSADGALGFNSSGRQAVSRHATCFFYLKAGEGAVARVEFPRWVAEPEGWLDRLHALILQQIEKGDGYPVALMEAHEHAVVRPGERELFYQLLEELMTGRGFQPRRSAKAMSKSRPLV